MCGEGEQGPSSVRPEFIKNKHFRKKKRIGKSFLLKNEEYNDNHIFLSVITWKIQSLKISYWHLQYKLLIRLIIFGAINISINTALWKLIII